jgi:hypothetical protein
MRFDPTSRLWAWHCQKCEAYGTEHTEEEANTAFAKHNEEKH